MDGEYDSIKKSRYRVLDEGEQRPTVMATSIVFTGDDKMASLIAFFNAIVASLYLESDNTVSGRFYIKVTKWRLREQPVRTSISRSSSPSRTLSRSHERAGFGGAEPNDMEIRGLPRSILRKLKKKNTQLQRKEIIFWPMSSLVQIGLILTFLQHHHIGDFNMIMIKDIYK